MSELAMRPVGGLAARDLGARKRKRIRFGLAARVLLLNIIFVIAAATIVYVPSIASYRDSWLRGRLSRAYIAALVLDAAPHSMIPSELSRELLDSVGARTIALSKHGNRQILAGAEPPRGIDEIYDFHEGETFRIVDAIETLIAPPGRVIAVLGEAPRGGESIAITMDEAPLTKAMRAYSLRLLGVTLFMSLIVASLATIAIHVMVLRPVRRLTDSLIEFGANPETPASRIIVPGGGTDEIARAQEELAKMQNALLRELKQKKHLAALGLAVAKISHDMRNMLTPAQLLSDRLANADDPLAQRLAPKLAGAIGRAVKLCEATLAYGRATDDPPALAPFVLDALVGEVIEVVALESAPGIEFCNKVEKGFEVLADCEQMFRVLMNLVRNAAQALESTPAGAGSPKRVSIQAWREEGATVIEIADTGPGVPQDLHERLFTPFGSGRSGGSGLGLAIAADLVRGHGGTIGLAAHDQYESPGAVFRITLPERKDLAGVNQAPIAIPGPSG